MNKVLEDIYESAVQEKFRQRKSEIESKLKAAVSPKVASYENPLGSAPPIVASKIAEIVEAMLPVIRAEAEAAIAANIRSAVTGTNKLIAVSNDYAKYDPFGVYR